MAISVSIGHTQALNGREAGLQATHYALNRLRSGAPAFSFVIVTTKTFEAAALFPSGFLAGRAGTAGIFRRGSEYLIAVRLLARAQATASKGNEDVKDNLLKAAINSASPIAIQRTLRSPAAWMILTALALPQLARSENTFLQHNLVSDLPGIADFVDPNLVNPWGISASTTSPFWISNNHSGTAKIYDSAGKPASLVVTLRMPGGTNLSTPTGQVFNGTSAFILPGGKPALFLFATEDGTISGWYSGIENNEAVITVNNGGSGAIYKGLAIGSLNSGPVLYAANFHEGTIDVYSGDFSPKTVAGAFTDPTIPTGFAPFNVYASGGKLYVAYAKQDNEGLDDVPGDGDGYINVFDLDGKLLQRLVSGGRLNSPWGMAMCARWVRRLWEILACRQLWRWHDQRL